MSIGKGLRFEILKRDGFRCVYCGATPAQSELRVDHIIPRAKGGTDDPGNLTTACFECNAGKTDRHLHEQRADVATPASEIATRLAHAKALLDAQREVEDARELMAEEAEREWLDATGREMPITVRRALKNQFDKNTAEEITRAITAVGVAEHLRDGTARAMYFFGVLRNMREQREALEMGPEERTAAAKALCEEARALVNAGEDRSLRRAESLARRAVELDPAFAWAHQLIGCALMRRRMARGARRAFEQAKAIAPSNPTHRLNLGLAMDSDGAQALAIAELLECARLAFARDDFELAATAYDNISRLYEKTDQEQAGYYAHAASVARGEV